MKKLFFLCLVALMATNASALTITDNLDVTGQVRTRLEFKNNYDFDSDMTDDYAYTLLRSRIGLRVMPIDEVSIFVEVQDTRMFDNHGTMNGLVAAGEDGTMTGIHQAYFDVKAGDMITFRVGRQEVVFGDERLVGNWDWGNPGRRFEGATMMIDVTDTIMLQPFYFNVGEGAVGTNVTTMVKDTSFLGMWTDFLIEALSEDTHVNAFLFLLDNFRTHDSMLWTLGGRFNSKMEAFDFGVEIPLQFGDWNEDVSIFAWMFHGHFGYTFDSDLEPRIGIRIEAASGDDDGTDDTVNNFNQMFPTNHKHLGYIDFLSYNNLLAIDLEFGISFAEVWRWEAMIWYFQAMEDEDGQWKADGSQWGYTDIDETAIGTELDTTITYQPNDHLNLLGGISYFMPSDRLGDDLDNAFFGYIQAKVML